MLFSWLAPLLWRRLPTRCCIRNVWQINTKELNKRKRMYDSLGVSKQFHYVFDLQCGLQIDASAAGNLTRFMNHHDEQSSSANVRAALVNDYGIRRVVFRAHRDIACGEEMCCESLLGMHWSSFHISVPSSHGLLLCLQPDCSSKQTITVVASKISAALSSSRRSQLSKHVGVDGRLRAACISR